MDLTPFAVIKQLRDIVDVLHNTSKEIFETKKKGLREDDQALATQIGQGKDVISIYSTISFTFYHIPLTDLEASEEDKLSDNEVLGQIT